MKNKSPKGSTRVVAILLLASLMPGLTHASLFGKREKTSPPPLPTDSKLVASPELIERYRGNFEGFMSEWLGPANWDPRNGNWKQVVEKIPEVQDFRPYEYAPFDSFKRFCTASAGTVSSSQSGLGVEWQCSVGQDEIGRIVLGRLSLIPIDRGPGQPAIQIHYQSKKLLAERDEQDRKFEDRLAENGPTGWIQTEHGKFRVLRFGTFSDRKLLVINGIPLEDLRQIELQKGLAKVTHMDGRVESLSPFRLGHQKSGRGGTYINDGWRELSVVVLDDLTQQPYVRLTPGEKVRAVFVDPSVANTPLGVPLTTTAIINSREAQFQKELNSRAAKANAAAREKVRVLAGSRAIDGQPGREEYFLPDKAAGLMPELNRISNGFCYQTPSGGMADLNAPLVCRQVNNERALLAGGAPASARTTPIAIIVLGGGEL